MQPGLPVGRSYPLRFAAWAALVVGCVGHGAMSFPRPRNSLDGALAPWSSWSYPCDESHAGPDCALGFCEDGKDCQGSCPISAHSGAKNALNASNGQACYWFSNGCTVGCDACDGTQNHVGHGNQRFLYRGMSAAQLRAKNLTTADPWSPAPGEMVLDPTSTKGLAITPNCDAGKSAPMPTVCDPRLRTVNSQAECGGAEDIYFYSPWRAPGAAPVIDPCGSAGGRFVGQGIGGAGAQFQNSSLARQGDRGSGLPPMAPQAYWQAGASVEVGWTVAANHGGGYAYRLARADEPLSEAAFRRTPLDFVGKAALRWDGDVAGQLAFDPVALGWQTDQGTVPAGSSWRKNPIPTVLWEREGPSFEPLCSESEACRGYQVHGGGAPGEHACRCSGHSNGGPLLPNLEMVDRVRIPATLRPGPYVLQWRWDCEESDQVWASCADVSISAPSPVSISAAPSSSSSSSSVEQA
mmetsp:Transcript_70784/g.170957  ORF Transcript_70784/g.170957 Transcript_70784/m.170957 type:complete len:466 (+) Transcript_70784:80-1477(+)